MPPVPDKVLAWLHNVLQVYQDHSRTYSDTARVLESFPALKPRTEVYTYESGTSALLLALGGTLPVDFRGTIYQFPIKLWVPQSYPQEPPIVYMLADGDLQIRAGQHVSMDGRVYHPYLRDWSRMWDRASIEELLTYLIPVFAREPPVISRAHQQQYPQSVDGQARPPPSLPPKQNASSQTNLGAAPPRPPKPNGPETSAGPARDLARDGPPLPPLPGTAPVRKDSRIHRHNASSPAPQVSAHNGIPQRYQQPAPQPWPQQQQHQQQRDARIAVSPIYASNRRPVHDRPVSQMYDNNRPPMVNPPNLQQGPHLQYQPQNDRLPTAYATNGKPTRQLAPDLLSDPFDIALPSTTPAQAPPIPPNPEREHLLQILSTTLVHQASQKVQQNYAAIEPLQMQHHALQAARSRLQTEMAQLDALDAALASNEAILHRSLNECDQAIATAKSKPRPAIDDVLVAPTLVARQLWTASAEEAACREAMYALQNAVDRGRITGVDFVRQMRGLGRECFLKMALARKCAQGLGLQLEQT